MFPSKFRLSRCFFCILLVLAEPSFANTQFEGRNLLDWLCKNLTGQFSMENTIASFPFESLPAASRSIKTEKTIDDEGVETIRERFDFNAKGKIFRVGYDFQVENGNLTNSYGHTLTISRIGYLEGEDKAALDWLKQIGKPAKVIIGMQITSGPPIYKGGNSRFDITVTTTGTVYVNWWNDGDQKYMSSFCGRK